MGTASGQWGGASTCLVGRGVASRLTLAEIPTGRHGTDLMEMKTHVPSDARAPASTAAPLAMPQTGGGPNVHPRVNSGFYTRTMNYSATKGNDRLAPTSATRTGHRSRRLTRSSGPTPRETWIRGAGARSWRLRGRDVDWLQTGFVGCFGGREPFSD